MGVQVSKNINILIQRKPCRGKDKYKKQMAFLECNKSFNQIIHSIIKESKRLVNEAG